MITAKEIQKEMLSKKRESVERQLKEYGWAKLSPKGLLQESISLLMKEINEAGFIVERMKDKISGAEFYISTVPWRGYSEMEILTGDEPDLIRL